RGVSLYQNAAEDSEASPRRSLPLGLCLTCPKPAPRYVLQLDRAVRTPRFGSIDPLGDRFRILTDVKPCRRAGALYRAAPCGRYCRCREELRHRVAADIPRRLKAREGDCCRVYDRARRFRGPGFLGRSRELREQGPRLAQIPRVESLRER